MTVMASEIAAQHGDNLYDWADAVTSAMETRPLGTGWTPSSAGRKAKLATDQARAALEWLAADQYIDADGRGAWTRYYLQPRRYGRQS